MPALQDLDTKGNQFPFKIVSGETDLFQVSGGFNFEGLFSDLCVIFTKLI